MYYGKKKMIIIITSIVVGVLAIGGILLFLFLGTDIFKSNKTLFWKYALNMSTDNAISMSQLEDIEKMMQQKPYKVNGKLTGYVNSNNDKVDIGQLILAGETDNKEKYSHINANYKLKDEKLIEFDFVKATEANNTQQTQNTQDTQNTQQVTNTINTTNSVDLEDEPTVYALKSEDIVTAYLGIRDDNLNVLAQKLGVNSDLIPDKIEGSNISFTDLFKISDTELQYIFDTYGKIITDYIPDSNYKKTTESPIEVDGKTYKTTAYRLDLSGTEIKELLINILSRMQADKTMLNIISTKIEMLGIDTSENSPDYVIKDLIDVIKNYDEFTDISIVVYNNNGINVATEIIVKNNKKITLSYTANKLNIKLEDLNGNEDTLAVSIEYKFTSTLSQINISFMNEFYEILNLDITNEGSASQGQVTTKIVASSDLYNLEYNQEIEFVDDIVNKVKLDQSNCYVLNDYSKEVLADLIKQITARVQYVYNEKAQILSTKIQSSGA